MSSSHIATNSDDDEPEVYTIIKISGKGMGMVANTDIPPGKLIIEEKPLLSVPLTASGDLPGRVRLNPQIYFHLLGLDFYEQSKLDFISFTTDF